MDVSITATVALYLSPINSHLSESSQYGAGEKREWQVVEMGWIPQLQLFPSHVPGLIDWYQ